MMRAKEILMRRDGVTETEAVDMIRETREAVIDAIYHGDFDLAEDIFMSDLGLETDYLIDMLI